MKSLTTIVALGLTLGCICAVVEAADNKKAQEQPVKVLQDWQGMLPDNAPRKAEPADGMVLDQDAWARLWKAWRGQEELPAVAFKKEMLLVFTADGPNTVGCTPTHDGKGNVTAMAMSTRIGGLGFGYLIQRIPREGIKTLNGKPLPGVEAPLQKTPKKPPRGEPGAVPGAAPGEAGVSHGGVTSSVDVPVVNPPPLPDADLTPDRINTASPHVNHLPPPDVGVVRPQPQDGGSPGASTAASPSAAPPATAGKKAPKEVEFVHDETRLKVVYPNGGETFAIGDTVVLRSNGGYMSDAQDPSRPGGNRACIYALVDESGKAREICNAGNEVEWKVETYWGGEAVLPGKYKLRVTSHATGGASAEMAERIRREKPPLQDESDGYFALVRASPDAARGSRRDVAPGVDVPAVKPPPRSDIRPLAFRPVEEDFFIRFGGQSKVTLLESAASVEALIGQASAKQLESVVDFGKANVVLVSWTTAGPPEGVLKHEVKGEGKDRRVVFYVQGPAGVQFRGQRARIAADFFAVPKGVPVSFDARERF